MTLYLIFVEPLHQTLPMKDVPAIGHSHLVRDLHLIKADGALNKYFFVFHSVHRPLERTDVHLTVGNIEIRVKDDCCADLREIFVDLLIS